MGFQNDETLLIPESKPVSRQAGLQIIGVGAITLLLAWHNVSPLDQATKAQTAEEPLTPTPMALAVSTQATFAVPTSVPPFAVVGTCEFCNSDLQIAHDVIEQAIAEEIAVMLPQS
jgi:hypothetical protein